MAGNLRVTKMTVIRFPRTVCVPLKFEKPLPRQRVFYLGVIYTGPELCQDITRLYLKRHGKTKGVRRWSLITYEKYDEYSSREYANELDTCEEDDVPKMLDQYYVGHHIKIEDLQEMGWQGKVYYKSNVIDFNVNQSS